MNSTRALAFAGALLSVADLSCAQSEQKVYVFDAIDGDSLQLQRDGGALVHVHLMGIEAPGTHEEKRHPSKLQCDPIPKPPDTTKKKPPPKPLLCRLRVDGKDVGLAQLEAGQASYNTRYAGSLSDTDRTTYKGAERSAKEAKKGMWAE